MDYRTFTVSVEIEVLAQTLEDAISQAEDLLEDQMEDYRAEAYAINGVYLGEIDGEFDDA